MILHEVITTEKVPFSYRVAGMGARFLAWLTDCCLILLLGGMGLIVMLVLATAEKPGLGQAVFGLWQFVLLWGYFLFFEWLWQGQTPGKRVLGIRVIDLKGTSISFYQAVVRNVLRAVDSLPAFYGLGFVIAACNREQRRLGDLAAGTLVVHVERKAKPIQAVQEGTGEADRAWQALVRQRLGQLDRQQKQTLLDLCLRRDQLQVGDRARLFRATAEYFQGRLDLAPREFQSDEKFVLQLAAALSAEARNP